MTNHHLLRIPTNARRTNPDGRADLWTTEYLKDQFFLCLSRVKKNICCEDGKTVAIRKYYNQAIVKMYLIPIAKPTIPFVIDIDDLSPRVRDDFFSYCEDTNENTITYFLKDIALRFFENFDYEFTHRSVMKSLKVRLKRNYEPQ